jgi:hypothetical protein
MPNLPSRFPATCLALLLLAATAPASDLDDAPFGLRLQAALSRFSRYPDVAATGNASAGAPWGSSANPASLGWDPTRGISVQYSSILFDEGTQVHVLSESLALPAGDWGVWQPSLAQVFTNEETTSDGLIFDYSVFLADLSWAKRLDDRNAIGAGLSYSASDLEFRLGPQSVSQSDSDTFFLRLGALRELSDSLLGGIAIDYANTHSKTTEPGVFSEDTTHQILIRPGIGYRFEAGTRVFVDYQFAYFTDNESTLNLHRLYAGVDHPLKEYLSLRAGTVLDDEGNVAFTTGIGFFPSERVFFDLSYQYDMFPEVGPEFGGSHVLAIAVSFAF